MAVTDMAKHNPQIGSPLCRLPLEIRKQIFAYLVPPRIHIQLSRDNVNKNAVLRLSSCVNVNLTGDCYCFDRRRTDDPPQEIWARRLQSPWGIHWRCEELSGQPQHSSAWSLMASCKSMYDTVLLLPPFVSLITHTQHTLRQHAFHSF